MSRNLREIDPDGQLDAAAPVSDAELAVRRALRTADSNPEYDRWLAVRRDEDALRAEFNAVWESEGSIMVEFIDREGIPFMSRETDPAWAGLDGCTTEEAFVLHRTPHADGLRAEVAAREAEKAARKAAAEASLDQNGPIADGWTAKAEAAMDRNTGAIPAEILNPIRALPQDVKRHLPRWLARKL